MYKHKTLYKKLLVLNKNNLKSEKKIYKFKKKKWENFQSYLNYSRPFNKFKIFDNTIYTYPRFLIFLKNQYRFILKSKQIFSIFYGGLSKKYIKKNLSSSLKQKKTKKNSLQSIFLNNIENRLSVILYKAKFTKTIAESKHLIKHKQVFVNSKLEINPFYFVKAGDIISINKKSYRRLRRNLIFCEFWPIPPKNLQISYKLFKIIVLEYNNHLNNIAISNKLKFNINHLLSFYNVRKFL